MDYNKDESAPKNKADDKEVVAVKGQKEQPAPKPDAPTAPEVPSVPDAAPSVPDKAPKPTPEPLLKNVLAGDLASLTELAPYISRENIFVVVHVGHPNSPTHRSVNMPHLAFEIKSLFP